MNSMLLINYAIPKYSRRSFTKTLKAVLPRKKTSSLRIGINHHWNLMEERKEMKYNFSNLDFNNEINDNIVNETRERNMKRNVSCQKRKVDAVRKSNIGQHSNSKVSTSIYAVGPSSSLLTPPVSPQIGHSVFQFTSKPTISQASDSEVDGLSLTPCESEVFSY